MIHTRRGGRAGVTLMEVLLSMTLLSLLTVGMAIAMRVQPGKKPDEFRMTGQVEIVFTRSRT